MAAYVGCDLCVNMKWNVHTCSYMVNKDVVSSLCIVVYLCVPVCYTYNVVLCYIPTPFMYVCVACLSVFLHTHDTAAQ